ncbi:unnamed protein product [Caretta caretta]
MIFLFSSWDRIKVNGKDISSFALQEALEILQSTDDQITLEVQREKSSHKPPQTSDAATQTDSSWWDEQCPHREDFTPSGFNLFLGRSCYNYLLPQDQNDDNELGYLPTAPRDVENEEELDYKELALVRQKELSFSSCHTTPKDNYSICLSLTEEEDEEDEKGGEQTFLLPHDWDSGVGCTDGSTQLDENSGPDMDAELPYVQKRERADHRAGGTRASSELATEEFLTYEELSDSSFYGVSPEEYRRFQEILERKCHQYQLFKTLNQDQRTPHASEAQEEGSEQSSLQDQWLAKYPLGQSHADCPPLVGDSAMSEEKGTNHKAGLRPQNAVNGVRKQANVDKSTEGQKEPEPVSLTPENIATGPKALVIPYHARRYVSYMNLVQEDASVEGLINQPSPPMLSHQCSKGIQGKLDEGNRWSLTCKRSRQLLNKQQKSQLLKDRALRIMEERSGMTTDDDALSELKTGKYWNKAERRQHLLLSKLQKQRKELMVQSRMEQLKEDDRTGTERRRDLSIIELSQKKLMKRRSRRVLDNWITIQELLSHGTKSLDGRTMYSPLLSVTTV